MKKKKKPIMKTINNYENTYDFPKIYTIQESL